MVLDPRHAFDGVGAVLNTDGEALPGVPRLTLHVGLPQHADAGADPRRGAGLADAPGQARCSPSGWTTSRRSWACNGASWRCSSAGTRWGSASADGSIRLNWRLIHFRLPVIDYVVAHELSHLRVMDHSPRFWDTVRTVVPDYAAAARPAARTRRCRPGEHRAARLRPG